MEVLVGAPTEDLCKVREDFLRHFPVVELDERVARDAIALRQERRLQLPDASSGPQHAGMVLFLVTCNAKDFPSDEPGIRIPYQA